MKASELRVGNFLGFLDYENSKEFGEVLSIEDQRIEFSYDIPHKGNVKIWRFLTHVSAIPLTKKWLKKVGFKKVGVNYRIELGARMHIEFFEGNSKTCDIIQDGKYISFKYAHIKYVHQLQNLFFALTGEELTIKQ